MAKTRKSIKPKWRVTYQEAYGKCGRCGSCDYTNSEGVYRPCFCRDYGPFYFMVPSFAWRWDEWKGVRILWGIGFQGHRKSFLWNLGVGVKRFI